MQMLKAGYKLSLAISLHKVDGVESISKLL